MATSTEASATRHRRRRLGAEQRRGQLIDAAVSVVSSRGYRNASLAAIASEAGVSKGLVWHYFADGDDLMEQTARSTLVALRETVAKDLDLSAPRLRLDEYEETYMLQATLFQRGQDEGSLRSFDTRYMAVTYQGAIDTMLAYLDSHPGTDADEYAATVAEIFLGGIARPG